MDRTGQIDGERHRLQRIIALLLSLAGLAEGAASLPYPLRFILLKILRRAEIAGRNVVTAEARYLRVAPWLMSSAEAHTGNRPADALSLALCFRLLALALSNLSGLGRRFVRRFTRRAPQAGLADCALLTDCLKSAVRARDAPGASLTPVP